MRRGLNTALATTLSGYSRRELLRRIAGAAGAAGIAALLPACGGGSGPARTESALESVKALGGMLPAVSTVRSGLDHPWGLAFLADNSMLVTERVGRLSLVSADGSKSSAVTGFPTGRLQTAGHGGLLDVAVDHSESGDIWVYLSYAELGTGEHSERAGAAVARARLVGTELHDFTVIFRAFPKYPLSLSTFHYGSRLLLAGDDKLFITVGEGRNELLRRQAQWLRSHLGKIVRINRDGSVPQDNPFIGHEVAQPELWTLGHRNPQGLAMHPVTGDIWSSEHGPQGGDELNVIEPGHNYGWPKISYGCEYGTPVDTCTVVGGSTSAPGLDQPVTNWGRVRIAPSGMAFCDGRMFPEWRDHLILAGLGGKELWLVGIEGRAVVSRTPMFAELGKRFRHVRQAPDGSLLLLTDEDNGSILRVSV